MATKKIATVTETVKKAPAKKATTEKKPAVKKAPAKKAVAKTEVTDKPVKPKRVKKVATTEQILETLIAVPVQAPEPEVVAVLETIVSEPENSKFEQVLFQVNWALISDFQVNWALISDESNNYATALEILETNHTMLIDIVRSLTSYTRSRLSFAAKNYRFKFKTNRINFWTTMHQLRQMRTYVKA